MLPLAFAWLAAAAFAASLAFFLYSYFVVYEAVPGAAAAGNVAAPVAFNVLLFTIFALHHSLFARTGLKRIVAAAVGPRLERAVYSLAASLLFMGVCWWWRPVPGVLYELTGIWRIAGVTAVASGLVITALGARALDVWELAGVRQVIDRRGGSASPPARPLETRGVYGFVRHPIYFAWALLVFGAPQMSMTRFTFAVVSTLYLAVAIPFEERGLIETFGPDYASYRKKVRWRMLPGVY